MKIKEGQFIKSKSKGKVGPSWFQKYRNTSISLSCGKSVPTNVLAIANRAIREECSSIWMNLINRKSPLSSRPWQEQNGQPWHPKQASDWVSLKPILKKEKELRIFYWNCFRWLCCLWVMCDRKVVESENSEPTEGLPLCVWLLISIKKVTFRKFYPWNQIKSN